MLNDSSIIFANEWRRVNSTVDQTASDDQWQPLVGYLLLIFLYISLYKIWHDLVKDTNQQ